MRASATTPTWACGPPARTLTTTSPSSTRDPTTTSCCATGRRSSCAPCGRRAPADQAGQGLLPQQVLRVPAHVPVSSRGRRRSGRNAGAGYERRDWLPVNELGGATRHPAHLTEEQVAQQQVEASLNPGGPILQLSDKTYFLEPRWRRLCAMRGLRSVSFQLPCEEECCRAPSRTS